MQYSTTAQQKLLKRSLIIMLAMGKEREAISRTCHLALTAAPVEPDTSAHDAA
jgi:hypothetical protein